MGWFAPLLSPWCARGNLPTGVNLNQYAGPGSHIRWHSDNEPLFGPQYSPRLIVSLSLGNSVEFKVRRRGPGNVPSSIRLDHGDVLVMDGLAQLEYEHCTVSELQGPRVNLTYRWVVSVLLARWSASIPLSGVLPFSGSCPLGWGTALATVTTSPIFQGCVFLPSFFLEQTLPFFKGYGFLFCCTAEYASSLEGAHSMLP